MTSRCRVACSALFPEGLTPEQRVTDDLAELGALVQRPEANVIKLPNVSASIPQLKATIEELRGKGYSLPDYPDEPSTPEEEDVQARYDKVKGSAVNPVLREGNSDRRAPASVKNYARSHPHKMGAWASDSKTSVATMGHDDFRSNEQSVTFAAADDLKVELVAGDGSVTVLKESIPVLAGEIVDATFMSVRNLDAFLAEQMAAAQAQGVLFSIHLKATMMKVSDPIIFGHAVKTYFADVFAEARRHVRPHRRQPQRRPRRRAHARRARCPTPNAPPSRARSPRACRTVPRWRWSTPTAASPTCTSRATSSSTRRCRR